MEKKQELREEELEQVSGGNIQEFIEENADELKDVAESAVTDILPAAKEEFKLFKSIWKWLTRKF